MSRRQARVGRPAEPMQALGRLESQEKQVQLETQEELLEHPVPLEHRTAVQLVLRMASKMSPTGKSSTLATSADWSLGAIMERCPMGGTCTSRPVER